MPGEFPPHITLIVLGKPYFSIVRALDACKSFEGLVDVLAAKLPTMIGADDAMVVEFRAGAVVGVHGGGPIATKLRSRFDRLTELAPTHPLMAMVDFSDPGDLGFAVSDHLDPKSYVSHPFNREVKEEWASEDSLFGCLASCRGHVALITACRQSGSFKSAEREIFDAVLFFARSVANRISGTNPEVQVKLFLHKTRENIAFFVVRPTAEVLPINYASLRLSELWWGEDDAFHQLDEGSYGTMIREVEAAWLDPIIAEFLKIRLDLGGGEMDVHALPKLDGETLLIVRQPSPEPVDYSEAVDAVLTKRQREIMEWIAEGKTSAEVAIILGISPRTVEKHLEAVFQRLGVENRIGAVRRYLDLLAGHPL